MKNKADTDKMLDQFLLEEESKDIVLHEEENLVLEPLLDEINLIQNEGIKSCIRAILLNAHLFWSIPAAFEDHFNPPDEHQVGGNVLHTKRVVRIIRLMTDSYLLEQIDRDIIIAAALVHDVTKAALIDGVPTYDVFHPYTLDTFVQNLRHEDERRASESQSSTLYVEDIHLAKILRLVRCHMGPYSPIPETFPIEENEILLHLADLIAAHLHIILDGETVERRWSI